MHKTATSTTFDELAEREGFVALGLNRGADGLLMLLRTAWTAPNCSQVSIGTKFGVILYRSMD